MSYLPRRTASLVLTPALAIVMVACSTGSGASPASSTGPSAAPSTASSGSPAAGAIEHKTGATDVLLKYEEGGGFMMAGWAASQVPHFTLYGDGTVVFRNPALETPQPPEGVSVFTFNPLRIAKLSEEQIQEILLVALDQGGLAAARQNYNNDMVADASTAEFTIEAGGIKKHVSVYALGMEVPGGADAPARAAFQKLAERLTDFDRGGLFPTEVYEPAAYRAILLEAPGMVAADVRTWPWDDLTVADFKADADPNGLQFPHRTMTTAEIDLLDVKAYQGGFQGLALKGSDAKLYTVSLRPLLPGEEG